MPTLIHFFQLYPIAKWYDDLQDPCKRLYQKYYAATQLQRKYEWIDLYQESWIKVTENIVVGKIGFEDDKVVGNNKQLRFRLYFLTTYRNKVLEQYGKLEGSKYREISIEDEVAALEVDMSLPTATEEDNDTKETKLWTAFQTLGERCKELLRAKYFTFGKKGLSGKEIAEEFSFRTPKIAHRRLDDCRERLRHRAKI